MKKQKLKSLVLTILMIVSIFSGSQTIVSASVNVHEILFDWEFYYNNNPDLQKAFGKNQSLLYQHYNNHGKKEGRAPSEFFNPCVYLGLYEDLQKAYGSTNYIAAYDHFVEFGIKEQRQASNTFSIAIYKSNYEYLRKAYGDNNLMYLYHYKKYGKKEGRNAITRINTSNGDVPNSYPALTSSAYCEFKAAKKITVYVDADFSKKGTSNPYKQYDAYISKNDVCYIYKINSDYIQVNYPTSSGRRTGYIRTKDLLGSNVNPGEAVISNNKVSTLEYKNGNTYGYYEPGDKVYKISGVNYNVFSEKW